MTSFPLRTEPRKSVSSLRWLLFNQQDTKVQIWYGSYRSRKCRIQESTQKKKIHVYKFYTLYQGYLRSCFFHLLLNFLPLNRFLFSNLDHVQPIHTILHFNIHYSYWPLDLLCKADRLPPNGVPPMYFLLLRSVTASIHSSYKALSSLQRAFTYILLTWTA